MRRSLWVVAVLILPAGRGPAAQSTGVVFGESAETPQSMEDWQFFQTTYVAWNRDGTPWIGAVPPWSSYANSLNYNDGTDYDVPDPADPSVGLPNRGHMTSRFIPLSPGSALTFRCNYQSETAAAGGFDVRRLQIATDDTFQAVVFDETLGTTGADPSIGACAEMGVWHTHAVALSAAWGAVRLRFSFDTVDGIENSYAGWFVDDIAVTGAVAGGGASGAPADGDSSSGCSAGSAGSAGIVALALMMGALIVRR